MGVVMVAWLAKADAGGKGILPDVTAFRHLIPAGRWPRTVALVLGAHSVTTCPCVDSCHPRRIGNQGEDDRIETSCQIPYSPSNQAAVGILSSVIPPGPRQGKI